MLAIIQIPVLTDNYVYILHESIAQQTAVIDPAEAEPVLNLLHHKGWQLNYILNTHHHHDHTGANLELKQQTGCKIIGSLTDQHRIPGIDIAVNDGDQFNLGNETLQIIATPGHTAGHVCYYNREHSALFCGDTLFSLGCGRIFEGTSAQLWQSLTKLKSLPPDTQIYCAHEYTLNNARFALQIDPMNKDLQRRFEEIRLLRSEQRPTLPISLERELLTNPFLRTNHISTNKTNNENASELEIFSYLRLLKDKFQ